MEEEIIKAKWRFTVYDSNNGTNFLVIKYEDKTTHKMFNGCGYSLLEFANVTYDLKGHWEINKKYGETFIIHECTLSEVTNDKESIVGYLGCGLFKGIGIRTALKIYEMFGNDTIKVIETKPEELMKVKGIRSDRLMKFLDSYNEQIGNKHLIMFLQPFGIPASMANRIKEAYKDEDSSKDIVENIKENPFLLYNVKGITLPIIENMVRELNLYANTVDCVRAYTMHTLKQNEIGGSSMMAKSEFIDALCHTMRKLDLKREDIIKHIATLIRNNELYSAKRKNEEQIVGRFITIQKEFNIAQKLTDIKNANRHVLTKERVDEILEILKERDSELKIEIERLDKIQLSAVYGALCQKVFCITGGGGVGKTTITKIICAVYQFLNEPIVCLAPTGRASRVLTEITNIEASTFHSYFRFGVEEETADYHIESQIFLENTHIIIDEMSMVDINVFHNALKQIYPSCSLLLVGDSAQLPSVLCGNILKDIIESKTVSTCMLEKIYRQSENSKIYENAQKIKKGDVSIEEGADFHIVECEGKELEKNILNKATELINLHGIDNVITLSPYKDVCDGSVRALNNLIGNRINPLKTGEETMLVNNYNIHLNDRVMQTTRNRMECSNGDVGIVKRIFINHSKEDNDEANKEIEVYFPSNNSTYVYKDAEVSDLILAYASTIHKSQGSQYTDVILCYTEAHKFMLNRNVLYTAVSRCKNGSVWIFGDKSAIEKAINTEYISARRTMLKDFLCQMLEEDEYNKKIYRQITIKEYESSLEEAKDDVIDFADYFKSQQTKNVM